MKFPLVAGMEIRRVVARPHETRVYFDGVYFRFRDDEQWFTWHPFDDDQLWGFGLDQAQQEAIARATEAVVSRDVEAVRGMLDPVATYDGDIDVNVDMWGREDGEVVPLDETLRLTLGADAGGWRPQLDDLHML